MHAGLIGSDVQVSKKYRKVSVTGVLCRDIRSFVLFPLVPKSDGGWKVMARPMEAAAAEALTMIFFSHRS